MTKKRNRHIELNTETFLVKKREDRDGRYSTIKHGPCTKEPERRRKS